MRCVAPQTRKHWADRLGDYDDESLKGSLRSANSGLEQWKGLSTRHRHDWTIYRACCIREFRRRGLTIPPELGT